MTIMSESPYMTVPEVAEYLRRRESTIRAWLIRKRDFPQIRVGKSVLIPRDGLMAWIARQQYKAEPYDVTSYKNKDSVPENQF